MNDKKKIRNIICLVLSIIAAIGLFIIVFYEKSTNYDVVVLGDSNIGNFRDETSVTYVLENELRQLTGDNLISVFNAGFGGSTAVNVDELNLGLKNEASFSNLANAIVSKEFSIVLANAAARDDGDLDYYDEALRDLSTVNFSKVKVLVIAYGTNDQLIGIDVDSYISAIDNGIKLLQQHYPNMKIVVVTPFLNQSEPVFNKYVSIEDYATGIKNYYEGSTVSVFDAYNAGIVTEENISKSTLDGVHLSEESRRQYGKMLAGVVAEKLAE